MIIYIMGELLKIIISIALFGKKVYDMDRFYRYALQSAAAV